MYSIGENFTFGIDDKEIVFLVIGDVIIKGKEYMIVEDEENGKHVFYYDDLEEFLEYIVDEEKTDELIQFWQEEYYGTIEEVDLWEEDYEEKEDEFFSENEYLFEEENSSNDDDDFESYLDDLMDKTLSDYDD